MRRLLAAALVALALLGATGSDARTAPRSRGYWIVLASNRDGTSRAYSVRPDGSRLTPLLGSGRALFPLTVSGDGSTVAYDERGGAIYVSRANGTGVRRVAGRGSSLALSRNGKRLAFTIGDPPHVMVVGTDGRGLRRLTSGYDSNPSWSPDAKTIVFRRSIGAPKTFDKNVLVVRPLRGTPRVLLRGSELGSPEWSPDGRWIAYQRSSSSAQDGLYLVRPNGSRRHRVVRGYLREFAWSPDGRRLAIVDFDAVRVLAVDGRLLKRIRPRLPSEISGVAWSPDGRRFALETGTSEERGKIWVVGIDGRGLRRVAGTGANSLVGWTRLAPVRPPATPLPPSERVLAADTVATRTPVGDLSADGARVAFDVRSSAIDCDHVVVWAPATKALHRFGPRAECGIGNGAGAIYDVELAGSRAAWAQVISCGNYCEVKVESATLARRAPVALASDAFNANDEGFDFHVHGDGDLLVFNDNTRLVRIGVGSESCALRGDYSANICTTLRSGRHAYAADSVSAGRIAVREPDAVAVVDAQGSLVRVFPFGPEEVTAARLDGGRLVLTRSNLIEVYDVATGAGLLQRPLPSGYTLEDVDGGIALLRRAGTFLVLRLGDGRSFTLAPGRAPVAAELEPLGLYFSHATAAGGGRVVFMPRSEVDQKLGG
jgi:WD40 repeat protein